MKIAITPKNSVEPMFFFHYEDIFSQNEKIIELIKKVLNEPSLFSIRKEEEPKVEIIVNPSNQIDGHRGFKLFLSQQENFPINAIPILPSFGGKDKSLPQVSKIKRAMHKLSFITRTSKTALSKEMVLKDPDVKNSWVREYLPDTDLIQIQEDENKQQKFDNGLTLRIPQPQRLFNPQTTIHHLTDVLVNTKNITKPTESDFFPKEAEDKHLEKLRFDIFKADQKEKVRIIWSVFQKLNYFEKYQIPMSQFCEFIQQIRYKYTKKGNPFHNFDHGINVMYGCYYLSTKTSARLLIKDLTEFSLVLSGLVHDISHTAHTNLFEVNSMSKLAIRYHDKSVLEQHHLAVAFKILRKKESNILIMLSSEQMLLLRKMAIKNIMSTDIKQHFDLLKEFELRFGQRGLPSSKEQSFQAFSQGREQQLATMESQYSEGDISILTSMVIHSADFYGAVQEFDLSKKWSLLVNQEFQAQFREESERNIPQTLYLKDLDKREVLAKNEIGFVSAIVKPLWDMLNKFLGDDLSVATNNLALNIKEWEALGKEQKKCEGMVISISNLEPIKSSS